MAIEETVRKIFKDVLDVEANEIKPDVKLEQAFGVDSTEMVEITVGLKKALGVNMQNNELKKSQSFNDIVAYLRSKGAN